jgi:hypothetical protein
MRTQSESTIECPANINSLVSGSEIGTAGSVVVAVGTGTVVGGETLVTCSGGGEGRKPRRSRIVPHVCRIRSALPAVDISVRGVLWMAGTLSLVCGMVVGLGGARPDDRIGSDDPVKREPEAAVAAATTLEKKKGGGIRRILYRTNKNIPEECT